MKPIVAAMRFENCMIDNELIGLPPSQVFEFISDAMKESAKRGCSCYIGWYIMELERNETNEAAIKRGQKSLVETAKSLLLGKKGDKSAKQYKEDK